MASKLQALNDWVNQVAAHTRASKIHWCDGSDAESRALNERMLESGDLIQLNPETHPECYLHRSDPADVARVRSEEHTSELQSRSHLVCRLLLEKKKSRTMQSDRRGAVR